MLKYVQRSLEIGGQALNVHASAGVVRADDRITAFVHSWPDEAAFVAGEQPASKWAMVVSLPFDDEQPEQALSDAPDGPLHGATVVSVQWPPVDMAELKARKNAAINAAREKAELSGFSHAGKWFQSATLDQRNIDKVAWHIARHNTFPADFPGAWKAADNTWLPMPAASDFDAFMNSLIARGTELFSHAQALKAQLAAATTAEEVAAVPDW